MNNNTKTWKEHIESIIQDSLDELSNKIREMNDNDIRLCSLKNVNFNHGGHPCYSEPAQRSLYLLRYAPAYSVEYRAAFEEIFKNNHIIPGYVRVLSIGCGAFIDKASAYYAMHEYESFKKEKLSYYGVDIKSWKKDIFSSHKHTFIKKSISKLKMRDIKRRINIIIFPKSLPDITEKLLNKFLKNLRYGYFENKVCIINSNRQSDHDDKKSCNFVNAFTTRLGYELKNEVQITSSYGNDSNVQQSIWSVFGHFNFIQDAIDMSNGIYSKCPYNLACNEDCQRIIDRFPILNTRLFNTKVYCLEKSNAME